ncbi:protein sickie isoform X3 [Onthophagus taurus]|uniref:protein sickie isoform X3 n=1 Tax=Onthophagus taurus TaxID=166361 RepID=UPI000C203B83|nr:protein sickie isoform X3 [Onthophagus taurus]
MFPGCIRAPKSTDGSTDDISKQTKSIVQIYTDWANHYLDKARSKKRVNCLATDCSDGILLAEVIESVTCQKIPDINRKPKTPSQMLDNVNLCLGVLRTQNVAGIENISGQDLRDGRLKAILALFFALSRHKQAAKQKVPHQQSNEMTPSRSTSIPHKGGSSIPLPGSALPSRKCPPDKVRPVASSSRASSPALSMIPRGPPAPNNSPYQQPKNQQQQHSLLKLFKSPTNERTTPTSNGKRTSSSSGVSSARSEKSDSSTSIEPNIDLKTNRNNPKVKQQRGVKPGVNLKNSPNANKKEMVNGGIKVIKTSQEVERHANKVASLNSKLAEPKTRLNQSKDKNGSTSPNTGIPKPTAAIKGTSKPKTPMVSRESSQASISRPTVAMVSPIKMEHPIENGDKFPKEIDNIKEEFDEFEKKKDDKIEKDDIFEDINYPSYQENISSKISPPHLTYHKDRKDHKPINIININSSLLGSHEEEPSTLNVEPMRPLFREYCSTLTLPSRPRHYPRVQPDGSADYCEISLANGYLSDGEILRNPINRDVCDGYMSEGGSALYVRRLQTIPQNTSHTRINHGLAVLTEQGTRRGRLEEPQQPPPTPPGVGPRSSGSSRSSRNQNGQCGQWKRYTDSPGVGSPPPPPPPAPSSPGSSRRERKSSPHGANKDKNSSKVRGVPQSFAYVKRSGSSNGTANGTTQTGSGLQQSGKTAQVSAVPRTKVKVSGGTQTCSSDLQPHKNPQFKSFSLTGNTATQLSQSVRERLMMHGSQSLPKGAGQEYGLVMRQVRPKASDGSLSDTQAIENTSPYAPWLRHSNTYSVAPRLSETDSMESLSSLPGHRGSLTHTRLLRDSPSRLSRSNSISYLRERTFPRSTKSEKLYPSMLHRNTEQETEPYYCLPVGAVLNHWSQPTSPAPGTARTFPLSPTHSTPRHSIPKNDDVHGSSISLVSTASSLYSSAEEKHAHEIRKLRRELMEAQEKVQTLTSQLSTNAHVVAAFEQSLSSMTQRLQHLTATSEKKDSELTELRAAMESLRVQSLQAGIGTGLARQPSSDSVSSLSSACSLDKQEKKKKKGWLRSSFTKAFSRNAKVTKVQCQSEENERQQSPPPPAPMDTGAEVAELQKQLREKDLVLTDIRLEALSSAHQLESLKDTVMKMRSEMLSLKQNNERLQRMVSGTISNGTNLPPDLHESRSLDHLTEMIPADEPPPEVEPDGKRIVISVYLGQPQTFERYFIEHYENDRDGSNATGEIAIAHTSVGAATTWNQIDGAVRRAFKQHISRLDPGGGLGLGIDAISSYKLGEADRIFDSNPPDLLPVGYVVGRVMTLHIVLQPVAAFAFEALIPKGVAQRLVSLLSEHRRIVLCGAPGTGKTHLATRLAEFHAQSLGRDPVEAVATFNVDNKSGKELRQYLAHLSEQAAAGDNSVLPCVVVLDNLHKAGPLADALGSLPRNLPCLLGTMAQSACSATSLQLQHGFRWVLVAPHMEPARGLLGRVLRRRLASLELEQGPQPELAAILGWLPRVWQHLNAFLETHSSGDVAIGPRLFLSCPLELDAARAWFADVWNYSLAPYLREAAREGLQLYGRRAAWTDPCQFVLDTYPWPGAPPQGLTSIPAKDVGLESGQQSTAENDGDPLLNMLMRLQEAANYSSPHSNDSDCNSLDSNMTHGSNLGTESVS